MVEDEYCVARRTHTDGKPYCTFVDHHEWRFLREYEVYGDFGETQEVGNVYYCVFCLKLEKRRKDGTPTEHR